MKQEQIPGLVRRKLQVVDIETGEVVHELDVTGRGDRYVEKVMRGMLINMNRDKYFVDDTAVH